MKFTLVLVMVNVKWLSSPSDCIEEVVFNTALCPWALEKESNMIRIVFLPLVFTWSLFCGYMELANERGKSVASHALKRFL